MKTTRTPLWVPILWFITTGIWSATLAVDFIDGDPTYPVLTILHILCVVASLFAAIANLVRYNKTKE